MVVVAGDLINPVPLNRTGLFRKVLRSMSGRIEKLYLQECSMLYCVLPINRGN